LGHEADHSPPSNAEVKEWVEHSWGEHRDNFTFTSHTVTFFPYIYCFPSPFSYTCTGASARLLSYWVLIPRQLVNWLSGWVAYKNLYEVKLYTINEKRDNNW